MRIFFSDGEFEKKFKDVFDDKKRKCFLGYIDSRSKVMAHRLKQVQIGNPNYEFLLKAVGFNLLSYLIHRLSTNMPNTGDCT